jgi:hypothetical protein
MFTMELDEKYEWSKKGKRYRMKYLSKFGQLFGETENDKDRQAQEKESLGREVGTDKIHRMA